LLTARLTKRRVYEIVEKAELGDRASRIFDISILSLIVLNIAAFVAETVEPIHRVAPQFFRGFEIFSVMVFTVEYVLRLWSVTSNPEYEHPVVGRLRFARTPMALIDLVAVLPFYLPFLGVDLRFVRGLRLFRLFRVFKLGRYSEALRTFGRVFAAKKEELGIAGFGLALLLLLASSLMYFAERDTQPEVFSSIPAATWWAVTTLTTVGYGDICPVTTFGKIIGSIIAILGIAAFALPTGILGAGFVEQIRAKQKPAKTCPHCGRPIE
jgi:voltage-gated potassium channel